MQRSAEAVVTVVTVVVVVVVVVGWLLVAYQT
jgi:hypothetical protein